MPSLNTTSWAAALKRNNQLMHFENLELETMASGNLCVRLTENVSWERFPSFAKILIGQLHANVIKKSDMIDARFWHVCVRGVSLRLVFEDYPCRISLESESKEGDLLLKQLYDEFRQQV